MINFQSINETVSEFEGGQNAMIYIRRYIPQAIKNNTISPVELKAKLATSLTHVTDPENKEKISSIVKEFLISQGVKIEMDISEMIHNKMCEIKACQDEAKKQQLKKERDELMVERRRQCGRV